MRKSFFALSFSILLFNVSFAQSILNQYVQEGCRNNQIISQKEFALEKSVYALKEAKSLFLPSISLMTDYFLGEGGRTVDFPAGDLLNPVYISLNQLTNSNNFPKLNNQSIQLNPSNFYDVKFRTTMPMLNLEIEYNKRIKKDQVAMQQVEIDLYKRELVKEIKIAYFKYLQSIQAFRIYEAALALVKESKRVNESLFKNDKVNRTVVLRAENEVTNIEAMRENALQNSKSAKSYFNFLLNRNLTDQILIDSSYQNPAIIFGYSNSFNQREELKKLQIGHAISQDLVALSKSYMVPKISTFLDVGSQGFDWKFDQQNHYYFFGVTLQLNLYTWGRNAYKVKQSQLESKIIQSQTDYVTNQLELELSTSMNHFNSSLSNYQAAMSALTTSKKLYSDLLRLYKEGQVLFIELLDTQNQLIQSQLQVNISLYDTYIKAAEIERANASFKINNY